MKVKINENTIVELHKRAEKEVLKIGRVRCYHVNCLNNDSITCSECCFDVFGNGDFEIDYSKVRVDEE